MGGLDDRKQNLLRILDLTQSSASSAKARAQDIVESATLTESLAQALRPIVEAAPDDSALPDNTWRALTGAWKSQAQETDRLAKALGDVRIISATTQATALTTATSAVFVSDWVSKPKREDVDALQAVLNRPDLITQTELAMKRFGLDQAARGRSPLELVSEARVALERPGSAMPAPAAVLVPAREAINATLAALLRRRENQAPARSASAKIKSIGAQAGLAGLAADHFERLGENAELLLNHLSQAKQGLMDSRDVNGRFFEALQFVLALLNSLDPNKMKQ